MLPKDGPVKIVDYPRGQVLREVLDWLDRYLAPVNTPAGPPSR